MKTLAIPGITFELQFDSEKIKRTHHLLDVLDHKLRQRMLKLIHKTKRISVKRIYNKLDIEQSIASRHLRLLRQA